MILLVQTEQTKFVERNLPGFYFLRRMEQTRFLEFSGKNLGNSVFCPSLNKQSKPNRLGSWRETRQFW